MPRRDGTPTPQELAARRPPPGGGPPAPEAAQAALAATTAAARTAATAPPVIAPALTVAAVNAAAAGILGAFGRFLEGRRRDQEGYLTQVLEAEIPELPVLARYQVISDEMAAEKAYAAKVQARLDRDLPKALSITDPTIREAEVQKVLARERRITEMREAAMTARALGVAEQRHVETESPEGGFWHLSDHTEDHTLDCLAMGGKVWPHSVLRNYHPPLHGGCPCEIWPIGRAEEAGLLHAPEQWATPDQSLQAMQIAEATFEDDEFEDELAVLEVFYDSRWGKGTTKAGQFRPRRGGDPGSVLHRPRLSRMRLHSAPVMAVPQLNRELDVRDLRVGDLKEGDHVMVNGSLERVTKVHGGTPGLLDLEHTGMVHIDRDTIQGVSGGGGGSSADFNPSNYQLHAEDTQHNLHIQLRQRISALPDGKGMTVAGGVRIFAGNTGHTGTGGKSRPRTFRVHGPAGHQDVIGPDLATVTALRFSANSNEPDSLGGAHRYADHREALLTDAQREKVAEAPLVGWDREDLPVIGTGGNLRAVHPDGSTEPHAGRQDLSPVHKLPESLAGGGPLEGLDAAKVDATRKVIRAASDADLVSTRASWAAKDDPASRGIVALYDEEIARRGLDQQAHRDDFKPDLPKAGADDRFELRHASDGTLLMWDRQTNKVSRFWQQPTAASVEDATRAVNEENEAHRAAIRGKEPPPPQPLGGVSYEDVQKAARRPRPKDGAEVLPGHQLPERLYGEAPGLAREKALFRHFGDRLASQLGEEGTSKLGDSHLASPQAVSDTYFALNTGARQRMVDLHPDAARLVAAAAHERGLPLHPEAAKLIRRPSVDETPAPEHPAHGLARRVQGMRGAEGEDMLRAAGYTYGHSQKGPDDRVTTLFHNHDQGVTMAATYDQAGHVISGAVAKVHEPVPEAERAALVGQDEGAAIDRMRQEGFSPGYTQSGTWMEFVHPDGRGRALHLVRKQSDVGEEVDRVEAFTPADREVQEARTTIIRTDPFSAVKPGDSYRAVDAALNTPTSAWHLADSGNTDDLKLSAGANSFVEFRSGEKRLVLHLSPYKEGGAGFEVVAVGHGSVDPAKRGQIVGAAQAEADAQVARAEEQRQTDALNRAAANQGEELRAAAEQGDAKALQKALEGRSVTAATQLLRQHGFQVHGKRRGGRGAAGTITYTLRGPGASTVKITGQHTFTSNAITKVQVQGNPQAGQRARLPQGQAPKNLKELLVDTLGRADELGQRFDAAVHVTGIVQGGVSRGAAAHHEPNGTIAIRKSHEGKEIEAYLKKRQSGQPLSDREHLDFYNHLETLQHEVNHGVGKRGDANGGLAFSSARHYQGLGKNVEEALTEENGHLLVADWLRSLGMTDVLAAVKRNPQNYHVLGVYQKERTQLKRVLDDAGIPAGEREALLARMKFQMSPEEQYAELERLAGADNLVHALYGMGQQDYKRRAEMERNFEPATRATLSDINAEVTQTSASGEPLHEGDTVEVETGDGRVTGVLTGLRGGATDGAARIRTDDGMELWYGIRSYGVEKVGS